MQKFFACTQTNTSPLLGQPPLAFDLPQPPRQVVPLITNKIDRRTISPKAYVTRSTPIKKSDHPDRTALLEVVLLDTKALDCPKFRMDDLYGTRNDTIVGREAEDGQLYALAGKQTGVFGGPKMARGYQTPIHPFPCPQQLPVQSFCFINCWQQTCRQIPAGSTVLLPNLSFTEAKPGTFNPNVLTSYPKIDAALVLSKGSETIEEPAASLVELFPQEDQWIDMIYDYQEIVHFRRAFRLTLDDRSLISDANESMPDRGCVAQLDAWPASFASENGSSDGELENFADLSAWVVQWRPCRDVDGDVPVRYEDMNPSLPHVTRQFLKDNRSCVKQYRVSLRLYKERFERFGIVNVSTLSEFLCQNQIPMELLCTVSQPYTSEMITNAPSWAQQRAERDPYGRDGTVGANVHAIGWYYVEYVRRMGLPVTSRHVVQALTKKSINGWSTLAKDDNNNNSNAIRKETDIVFMNECQIPPDRFVDTHACWSFFAVPAVPDWSGTIAALQDRWKELNDLYHSPIRPLPVCDDLVDSVFRPCKIFYFSVKNKQAAAAAKPAPSASKVAATEVLLSNSLSTKVVSEFEQFDRSRNQDQEEEEEEDDDDDDPFLLSQDSESQAVPTSPAKEIRKVVPCSDPIKKRKTSSLPEKKKRAIKKKKREEPKYDE